MAESGMILAPPSRRFVTVPTETDGLLKASNIFRKHHGGEGVECIQAAKASGYWAITLLSLNGRAFPVLPMLLYSVYSGVVVALMQLCLGAQMKDPNWARVCTGLLSYLSLIGVALFFLLTFRTNSAYARWWEGRCVWGSALAGLLAIASTVSSGNVRSRPIARAMLRWFAVFILSLMQSLRGEEDSEQLQAAMTASELQDLMALSLHQRPQRCIHHIKRVWGVAQDGRVTRRAAEVDFEKVVPDLVTIVCAARRVQNTPMPFAYISHLRSFLLIWLAGLPVVFVSYFGYFSILVCIVVGYALLGMEAISLEIESPFGSDWNDLPIENLTHDVLQVLSSAYEMTAGLPSDDGNNDIIEGACGNARAALHSSTHASLHAPGTDPAQSDEDAHCPLMMAAATLRV